MSPSTVSRANRVKLRDVQVNKVDRIATDAPGAKASGGGYPIGCVTLIGGEPGMGKSTLVIQVATYVRSTLYIASEEADVDIRARAERLKLGLGVLDALEVVRAMADTSIDDALSGPACQLVVLDSLPGLVGTNNEAGATYTLKKIKQYVVEHQSHAIVINHATKDDWFAGRLSLQHDVDCTLVLVPEGPQERQLLSIKNRHGASGVCEKLLLTDTGMIPAPDEEPEPKKGRKK